MGWCCYAVFGYRLFTDCSPSENPVTPTRQRRCRRLAGRTDSKAPRQGLPCPSGLFDSGKMARAMATERTHSYLLADLDPETSTIRTISGVFARVVDGLPVMRPRPPVSTARRRSFVCPGSRRRCGHKGMTGEVHKSTKKSPLARAVTRPFDGRRRQPTALCALCERHVFSYVCGQRVFCAPGGDRRRRVSG